MITRNHKAVIYCINKTRKATIGILKLRGMALTRTYPKATFAHHSPLTRHINNTTIFSYQVQVHTGKIYYNQGHLMPLDNGAPLSKQNLYIYPDKEIKRHYLFAGLMGYLWDWTHWNIKLALIATMGAKNDL